MRFDLVRASRALALPAIAPHVLQRQGPAPRAPGVPCTPGAPRGASRAAAGGLQLFDVRTRAGAPAVTAAMRGVGVDSAEALALVCLEGGDDGGHHVRVHQLLLLPPPLLP